MSTAVDRELLLTIKEHIVDGNLKGLQEYWKELQETEFPCKVDWTTLFQKVYLHACLKGKREIAEWFQTLFSQMDPIQQIGLRQVFPYGRYLLAKAVKTKT